MRKLTACEFITLDGVVQNEDEGDGFKWGGWFFPFADEVTGDVRTGAPQIEEDD